MRFDIPRSLAVLALVWVSGSVVVQAPPGRVDIPLNARTKLALTNGRVIPMRYRGRQALKLAPLAGHERDTDQEMFAVLTESNFRDGVIELDVAGARREGYSKATRRQRIQGDRRHLLPRSWG